jgi:AraC-like DNA-binding protein
VASPEYEPIRFEKSGHDLDEAREIIGPLYSGHGFMATPTDRPFFYRHTMAGNAQITLRRTVFDARLTGTITPAEDYIVTWLKAGVGTWDDGTRLTELRHGEPVVFPTGQSFTFDVANIDQRLVHIDRLTLNRIAAEHTGTPPGALVLDHTVVPTPASVKAWRSTLALVSHTLTDPDASPILQNEMVRIAGIALLGMFPPRLEVLLPAEILLPRNARIKAAVEYIHANAHLPITTTMIANSAGLSLRALQDAFHRIFEMTPTQYLRNARLGKVRGELQNQPPGSVSQTAHRWGFVHQTRFTRDYTARHGETPTETDNA